MAKGVRLMLPAATSRSVCRRGFDLINQARREAGKEPIEDEYLPRSVEHLRRLAKANKIRLSLAP